MKIIKIRNILFITLIVIFLQQNGVFAIYNDSKIVTSDSFFQKEKTNYEPLINEQIRSHAEFELSDELLLSSYFGSLSYKKDPYFIDIIKASESSVQIQINVNNKFQKNHVLNQLINEDIILDNITICINPTNSVWIRDYGPFFIEKNNSLSIIDFSYLAFHGRYIDDFYPTLYGLKNDIEFDFKANFALCIQGGNYMTDGQGTAMVGRDTLLINNPTKTEEELDSILKEYLGLNTVIFLESQIDDGTGHIDMFSKIINKDNVIVGQWDESDINYQIVENNTQLFLDHGYSVIRIPMLRDPDEKRDTIWTYTNSLIINGTNKKIVLVPQYNISADAIALSIYKQAMPEFEIIGINCNKIINSLGAIHCSTITRPLIL
jgi:agmatine deiminase